MILKKNKTTNFVRVDNVPIQSANLSYKAKGILAYLLSRPDDWETSLQDLVNHSPKEGIHSIRGGLNELVDEGYAALVTARDSEGTLMGSRYVVSDDTEWVACVRAGGVIEVGTGIGPILPISRDAVFPDLGKISTSDESDPTKKEILTKKESISHTSTPSDAGSEAHTITSSDEWSTDDWQYKAAKWWLDFSKEEGNLPPNYLKRNKEEDLIQKWAGILDKLNRIDGYEPAVISQVLGWLRKTKDEEGQGKFWLAEAQLYSLGNVRSPSRSNKEYRKFDMIYRAFERHRDKKPINQARRPERG